MPACDVTLFGNKFSVDDQLKMKSLEWLPIQCDCVLLKRRKADIDNYTEIILFESESRQLDMQLATK